MSMHHLRPRNGRGFTLVELLVVILIIAIISAVALPVVLPALDERRVSEAARELQGALAGARDAAIRANAPRGIRLLPDPVLSPPYGPIGVLASNRYVPIEPGPDYTEGKIFASNFPPSVNTAFAAPNVNYFLQVSQSITTSLAGLTNGLPNEPTGWAFNVRQGDKIRFNDSGTYYTIAGPMYTGPAFSKNDTSTEFLNSERYINLSNPDPSKYQSPAFGATYWVPSNSEFLNLVNGVDDDNDGWIDEGFDGIDNDGDGVVDPGYNGIDDNGDGVIDDPLELGYNNYGEFEQEVFTGDPPAGGSAVNTLNPSSYTIVRRAVVSPGTREVTLPDGIVIDMTTYSAATSSTASVAANPSNPIQFPERSRLPVDPYTFTVDILVSPSGQVVQAGSGAAGIDQNSSSPTSNLPFYHFWLTERKGVVAPLWDTVTSRAKLPYVPVQNPNYPTQTYLLPMPSGTLNYNPSGTQNPQYLTGERRLVTMFTRSGQVVTNSIEIFDGNDISRPFYDAQAGIKEPQ